MKTLKVNLPGYVLWIGCHQYFAEFRGELRPVHVDQKARSAGSTSRLVDWLLEEERGGL